MTTPSQNRSSARTGRQPGLRSGDSQSTCPDRIAKTRRFYAEGSFGKYTGFLQPRDEALEEKKKRERDKHMLFQAARPRTCHSRKRHTNMKITGIRHQFTDKQQLPQTKGQAWEHMALLY